MDIIFSFSILGEIKSVNGTYYDLREPKILSDLIPKKTEGFDINYCINGDPKNDLCFVARYFFLFT